MRFSRTSGVLLHPTSLPGPHGCGDFGPAAYHFIDWLVSAGQTLWQILPLGSIGPGNSPYMSSSAFAGNLLLLDLAQLHERGWLDAPDLEPDAGFSDGRVHFERVVPWRMARLERAAQRFSQTASAQDRADLAAFEQSQSDWLADYALFMALADAHDWADWSDWPVALAQRKPQALQAARAEHATRIAFWTFCQWCFFQQWQRLKDYANTRGILVVGDAPIFIAYQSAEVWAHQELFELDEHGRALVVAGVPPDFFSATGQRWGNPLYRWSAHQQDNYAWWTQRIRHTFALVDIVRIDHFRGFVDYWEIPGTEPTAIHGRWVAGPGAALFAAIEAELGPLPIIAEDLGIITPEVDALRRTLDLPGMRVLHFAFGDHNDNAYLPHNYEPHTVVYSGTHDNNTSQGWWADLSGEERKRTLDYLRLDLADAPNIHWELIAAASASVADTAIHQMQDVLGLDGECRMNLPGVAQGYWEWRFSWTQVHPEHAERLARLSQLYRRERTIAP